MRGESASPIGCGSLRTTHSSHVLGFERRVGHRLMVQGQSEASSPFAEHCRHPSCRVTPRRQSSQERLRGAVPCSRASRARRGASTPCPERAGVRGPMACGQKPLTLSRWERGQETMAKKVIGNRTGKARRPGRDLGTTHPTECVCMAHPRLTYVLGLTASSANGAGAMGRGAPHPIVPPAPHDCLDHPLGGLPI